jgi:hypothetical protein
MQRAAEMEGFRVKACKGLGGSATLSELELPGLTLGPGSAVSLAHCSKSHIAASSSPMAARACPRRIHASPYIGTCLMVMEKSSTAPARRHAPFSVPFQARPARSLRPLSHRPCSRDPSRHQRLTDCRPACKAWSTAACRPVPVQWQNGSCRWSTAVKTGQGCPQELLPAHRGAHTFQIA